MSNLANGRISVKFSYSALVQKKFFFIVYNFILNSYLVYELNNWPHNPSNNFTIKNCSSGTVKLIRHVNIKFISIGQGIAYDGTGSWSFGNDFERNVAIFVADISSSHINNRKNNNVLV